MKHALSAMALLLVSATAADAGDHTDKWGPWLDAGAFHSNRDETRGESTLWVPLVQSPSSVFFGEARVKLFEEDAREGNFALGYRQMLSSGWNLGAWGGYDVRSTGLGSTFDQVSGGVEALSRNWDFRLNGYLPLEESELASSSSFSIGGTPAVLLNGSNILLQTGTISSTSTVTELALGGFDAEIGVRLPVEALKLDPARLDLRLYGGGFHFDNPDADKAVAGPKARAELRFNDVIDAAPGSRLTLEAEYTRDDVRGERLEAGARFRIPLGGGQSFAAQSAQEQRMSEGLRRDTDLVSSSKTETTHVNTLSTEAVADAATNIDLDKVAYVDGGTAGGISGVATAQGANTLIIANGGNGNFTSNTLLQSQQTLMSGGGTITLQGKTTGTLAPFTAPGAQATLVGQAGNYTLRTQSDNHIAGFDIQAGPSTGGIIIGSGANNTVAQNVVIDHNTIAANGHDGIVTASGAAGASSSQVVISQNTITGAVNAINAFTTSDIEIRENVFTGSLNTGVILNVLVSDATIADNTIDTAGGIAIWIAQNSGTGLAVTGNTLSSTAPILISGNSNSGVISNNAMDSRSFAAIRFTGSNNVLTGSGNTGTNGTLCSDNGSNPGSSIQFVGGATCP